jgi:hypothetical protein
MPFIVIWLQFFLQTEITQKGPPLPVPMGFAQKPQTSPQITLLYTDLHGSKKLK